MSIRQFSSKTATFEKFSQKRENGKDTHEDNSIYEAPSSGKVCTARWLSDKVKIQVYQKGSKNFSEKSQIQKPDSRSNFLISS